MAPKGLLQNESEPPFEDLGQSLESNASSQKQQRDYKPRIIWINAISITLIHVLWVYTLGRCHLARIYTWLWGFLMGGLGGFGVTAGAHRLWAHRAYKAKWPLRIILVVCYSIAGQNTLYDWVRDHRVHHKFTETDADPHNSIRGFFFAHVGWLMQKKHPDVIKQGRMVDMSDIENDPIVAFHTRYFTVFKTIFCFFLPTFVPWYFWNEKFEYALLGMCVFRYVLSLNFTWLVNSAAHMWGYRPYSNKINPAENKIVSVVAMGEGWHNYHHIFPWDYKAAELGDYKFNITTLWLDIFQKIGWAYDMKTPSPDLVKRVAEKFGDGTHPHYHQHQHHHHHHHHHNKEVTENGEIIDLK